MVFICSVCGEWFRNEKDIYFDETCGAYICTHCVKDNDDGN